MQHTKAVMYNLIFHALICIYKINYDKITEPNSYYYNLSDLTSPLTYPKGNPNTTKTKWKLKGYNMS